MGNILIGQKPAGVNLQVYGDNNIVRFGKNVRFNGQILLGYVDSPVNNAELSIGDNTTAEGCNIWLFDDNSKCIIGSDCLISNNVDIWASDTHTIFNADNKCVNFSSGVIIHDHVWIGQHVKITKNTEIVENSVVGIGSIVTKKFTEPGSAIAGNPACVVKHIHNWSRLRPNQFIAQYGR